MRKLSLISLAFIVSCSVLNPESDETKIRYVVKDFSETPVDKIITYTNGRTGGEIIVWDNHAHWERTVEFKPKLDAALSVKTDSNKLIPMGVYIYKNGDLANSKEYNSVHSLSVSHWN